MIRYTTGNLLNAPVEALVNPVNTAGVMGKGLALQFREAFPENYAAYRAACARGEVAVGRMLVTENRSPATPRWIINFPTKEHWRNPSQLEFITSGLTDLVQVLRERQIRSMAIPPLGCGLGGLKWADVKPLVEAALNPLSDVETLVFEPASVAHVIRHLSA